MQHSEAIAFIKNGVQPGPYKWADLGAGNGTFTTALSELLGPEGTVYAVDKRRGVKALEQEAIAAPVKALQADFSRSLDLPPLDGILMANALHFVPDPASVLSRLLSLLRPGGIFLLIEYDRERGNPWVPYPISRKAFQAITQRLGLSVPEMIHSRPSRYGNGELYAMICRKPEESD